MLLSCLPVSFYPEITSGRMTLGQFARLAATVGLDGIVASVTFVPGLSLESAEELRRQIEAEGMRIAMLCSYPDFTHPNRAVRRREVDHAITTVAVAAQLGAQLLRVTAGQAHPETTRSQGIQWAVEGLAAVGMASRGSGVTPVYENHTKPGVWDYTDFSQDPDIFLEIVRRTDEIGLGVSFDFANATAFTSDPLEFLAQVLPRVVSVHAADTAGRGALHPVLLGTGITPFDSLFATLHRAEWSGWICIEEASGQGPRGVAAAVEFVRSSWDASETAPHRPGAWRHDSAQGAAW